jgi:hypothetical protein
MGIAEPIWLPSRQGAHRTDRGRKANNIIPFVGRWAINEDSSVSAGTY